MDGGGHMQPDSFLLHRLMLNAQISAAQAGKEEYHEHESKRQSIRNKRVKPSRL
jgi:hypothetical protein